MVLVAGGVMIGVVYGAVTEMSVMDVAVEDSERSVEEDKFEVDKLEEVLLPKEVKIPIAEEVVCPDGRLEAGLLSKDV